MTRTADAAGGRRLTEILDRAEISELIDRYVVTLDTADEDERDLEWYRAIFTDDVRLSFPIGERTGVDGLAEFQRAARLGWRVTHHLSGNHLIDLGDNHARVRAQVIGTHVAWNAAPTALESADRMDMAGYYLAEAVRTPRGWRISALTFTLTWTSGGGVPRTGRR